MMTFEPGVFGLLAGLLYFRMRLNPWISLIGSMLGGRLVYGVLGFFARPLAGLQQVPLWAPITVGFVNSWPGVAVQLILIPPLVKAAQKIGVSQTSVCSWTGSQMDRVHRGHN